METISNSWQDESGASAAEYAMLVSFIAVVILSAVALFGQSIYNMFVRVADIISGIPTGS
jgi:Flp pilus assembly pilin Flp